MDTLAALRFVRENEIEQPPGRKSGRLLASIQEGKGNSCEPALKTASLYGIFQKRIKKNSGSTICFFFFGGNVMRLMLIFTSCASSTPSKHPAFCMPRLSFLFVMRYDF